MAGGFSEHTITHQLELYQALPIPQQLHNLCKLVTTVHDGGSGPSKLLVQGSLCQALLKSLQGGHSGPSPQQHDTIALAEAWNACASAFELIYTWEEEQVVLSVIQFWAAVSNLLCGSWLQQDQQASADDPGTAAAPHATTTGATSAASGAPAAPPPAAPAAVQLPNLLGETSRYLDWLWSLGHGAVAAVVQQLHQFWKVTGINHLQYQQQQQRGVTSQLTSLLLLFLELHHSSPAACNSSSSSSSQPAGQLLQLLHGKSPNAPRSTPAALTAAEAMSGVCCLLQAAAVLQATTTSSQHTSAQTPGEAAGPATDPMDVEESDPAAAAASIQHTAQPGSAAAPIVTAAAAAGQPAWPQLPETAGRLLRDWYGWCGFGEAANMSASAAAAASEAARYTAAGYGSSPAGGVCRPSSVESLYDCFMVLLAKQMMQGPHTTSFEGSRDSGGHSTGPASSVTAAAQLTAAETPAAAPVAATAGEEAVAGLPSSSLGDDEWEGWLDSEVFSSLAALVATYDRPGALVRALHILTQQQLMADDMAAVAGGGGGGAVGNAASEVPTAGSQPDRASKLSAKQASKSAMGRALLLIEKIFLWRHHRQQQQQRMQEDQSAPEQTSTSCSSAAAAAAGVCQLLLGLSELLRPAANCSVEWRCAALASMLAAVEEFLSDHPDECDLELQLWCEASVEGLLYCASHDPSVQARRAALQLLQHVVLPSSSPTASALMRCLADKVSDKDSGVATAALQLFVQLQPQVLCRCLTAAQWCSAVQAGLQLVSGTGLEGPDGQSSKGSQRPKKLQQAENAGLRDGFVQLLQKVLLAPSAPQQQQQQQGGVQWLGAQSCRIVGVEGCKQILLLLMCEPLLQDEWQALHDIVAVGVQ